MSWELNGVTFTTDGVRIWSSGNGRKLTTTPTLGIATMDQFKEECCELYKCFYRES